MLCLCFVFISTYALVTGMLSNAFDAKHIFVMYELRTILYDFVNGTQTIFQFVEM